MDTLTLNTLAQGGLQLAVEVLLERSIALTAVTSVNTPVLRANDFLVARLTMEMTFTCTHSQNRVESSLTVFERDRELFLGSLAVKVWRRQSAVSHVIHCIYGKRRGQGINLPQLVSVYRNDGHEKFGEAHNNISRLPSTSGEFNRILLGQHQIWRHTPVCHCARCKTSFPIPYLEPEAVREGNCILVCSNKRMCRERVVY